MQCPECNYRTACVPYTNADRQTVLWCPDCVLGVSRHQKQTEKERRRYMPRPYGWAAPVTVPRERISKGEGGLLDKIPKDHVDFVTGLIANFDVTSVSAVECKQKKDYVGKLPGERSDTPFRRIDRQGPSRDDTHAKFAVQIGTATYAGIEMPAGLVFKLGTVRWGFRKSIQYGTYALLSFG